MSNSKYIRLQELIFDKFNLDAPVEIEKGALLLESTNKTVLLQLRLIVLDNVDEISSISLNVYGFTDSGEVVEGSSPFNYTYSDIYLQGNKSFGDETPIILDSKIRKVTVTIEKVVYRNGDVWRNAEDDLQRPVQKSINSIDVNLLPQFKREISGLSETDKQKFLFMPLQFDDYWICTCGRPNRNGKKICSRCGLNKDVTFRVTDSDFLHKNLDKYNKKTRVAEEERKLLAEKRKRLRFIGLVSLIAIATILSLFFFVVQPALKYSQATSLLENKDFDGAISAFSALGDYKDSSDMIKESTYQKGMDLLSNKKFDDSITVFVDLGDYKDSSDKIKESTYQKAVDLLSAKKYDAAASVFSTLGDYKDSSDLIKESTYQKAIELFNNDKTKENSYDIFSVISDYKDSHEYMMEILYINGNQFLDEENFEQAIGFFTDCGEYKDCASLLQESMYLLAQRYLKQYNYTSAHTLFEELGDFKKSKSLLTQTLEDIELEKKYNSAITEYLNGNFNDAKTLFSAIPDYREANAYINKIAVLNGIQGAWVTFIANEEDFFLIFDGWRVSEQTIGSLYELPNILPEQVTENSIKYDQNVSLEGLEDYNIYYDLVSDTLTSHDYRGFYTFKRIS